ncbi:hypothetical protein H1235_10455 [Pseudoxanthomonas sp. NC8]|nr:hypothetical protein H1235_10455 [Pseudoxanthomonas sp. NC8]
MNTTALKATLLATAVAMMPAWALDLRHDAFDRSYTVSVDVREAMRALGWQGIPVPASGIPGWHYEMTASFGADRDYYHLSVHVTEHSGGRWNGGVCVRRPGQLFASA